MANVQEIESVAALMLHDPSYISVAISQTKHRFEIISKWNIPLGASILELGCGQGDCTTALAHAIGPLGHVTAVDPGPIHTYGSPYTLAQAQAHLSSGALGSRITWVEADPVEFLTAHPDAKYDFVVLAHCIWYFPSPATLTNTLRAVASHTTRVVIAEWALTASSLNAMPHVLAALTQASTYSRIPSLDANIRTALSPSAIKAAAEQCKILLLQDHIITPDASLQDGEWETAEVSSGNFVDRIKTVENSEKERCVLYTMRDAVLSHRNALRAREERVRCMDVWTGVFHVSGNAV